MKPATPRLFWIDPVVSGSGRGLFWPEPDPDPSRTELVAWDEKIDFWIGDDIVAATPPWVLMSPGLVHAIALARLTGLRIGAEATLRVPPNTSRDRVIGRFRIVVPEASVDLRPRGGTLAAGISITDTIECARWMGADFSYPVAWDGIVVSEHAMDLLRGFRLMHAQVRDVRGG